MAQPITPNTEAPIAGPQTTLERVPEVYRAVYGWPERRWIEPAGGEDAVVRRRRVGRGTAWMLRTDAESEDWARALSEAIPLS